MCQFKVVPFEISHFGHGFEMSFLEVQHYFGYVVDLVLLLFGLDFLALDPRLKRFETQQWHRDEFGGVRVVHLGLGPQPWVNTHLWRLAVVLDLFGCERGLR